MANMIRIEENVHRPLKIKAAELGCTMGKVIEMGLKALDGKKTPKQWAREQS